jgi:hypothetical protein
MFRGKALAGSRTYPPPSDPRDYYTDVMGRKPDIRYSSMRQSLRKTHTARITLSRVRRLLKAICDSYTEVIMARLNLFQ